MKSWIVCLLCGMIGYRILQESGSREPSGLLRIPGEASCPTHRAQRRGGAAVSADYGEAAAVDRLRDESAFTLARAWHRMK
jgi:hypothetical protein